MNTTADACRQDDTVSHMDRGSRQIFQELAKKEGTPLFVVDHKKIRENYHEFKKNFPRIQAYFAVKANSNPEIVKTLMDLGASFDVASMPEFMIVYNFIKDMPDKERQDWIWDRIIYANTIKPIETLEELNQYKPLVTFDNIEELKKIRAHAPQAGLVLRLRVPNTGSMVELSSKFGADPGEAVDLIAAAFDLGLVVEGLSFHVGSQCTNFENYVVALQISADIIAEAEHRLDKKIRILDIGGGFPVKYNPEVRSIEELAVKLKAEIARLSRRTWRSLPNPAGSLSRMPARLSQRWSGKHTGTASPAITSTMACTTPTRGRSSTTAPTRCARSRRGRAVSQRSSGRPAMRSIRSRSRPSSPSSRSAILSIRKISGPTRLPRPRTSTVFPRQKSCISTSDLFFGHPGTRARPDRRTRKHCLRRGDGWEILERPGVLPVDFF